MSHKKYYVKYLFITLVFLKSNQSKKLVKLSKFQLYMKVVFRKRDRVFWVFKESLENIKFSLISKENNILQRNTANNLREKKEICICSLMLKYFNQRSK